MSHHPPSFDELITLQEHTTAQRFEKKRRKKKALFASPLARSRGAVRCGAEGGESVVRVRDERTIVTRPPERNLFWGGLTKVLCLCVCVCVRGNPRVRSGERSALVFLPGFALARSIHHKKRREKSDRRRESKALGGGGRLCFGLLLSSRRLCERGEYGGEASIPIVGSA